MPPSDPRIPEPSFDEPTGVTGDPIEALNKLDRRLKAMWREQRAAILTDKEEHASIRLDQEKLEGSVEKVSDKLDKIIEGQLRVAQAREEAEIKTGAAEDEAKIQVATDAKILRRSVIKDVLLKILGPAFGAIGGLLAAYAMSRC